MLHSTSSAAQRRNFLEGMDAAILDREELGSAKQRPEQVAVRPGKPGLQAKGQDLRKQRLAPLAIQVRYRLVQQQDRRLAAPPLGQARFRQRNRQQQGAL